MSTLADHIATASKLRIVSYVRTAEESLPLREYRYNQPTKGTNCSRHMRRKRDVFYSRNSSWTHTITRSNTAAHPVPPTYGHGLPNSLILGSELVQLHLSLTLVYGPRLTALFRTSACYRYGSRGLLATNPDARLEFPPEDGNPGLGHAKIYMHFPTPRNDQHNPCSINLSNVLPSYVPS